MVYEEKFSSLAEETECKVFLYFFVFFKEQTWQLVVEWIELRRCVQLHVTLRSRPVLSATSGVRPGSRH